MADIFEPNRRWWRWRVALVLVCVLCVLGLAVAYFKWQSVNGDARSGVPAHPTTPAEWDAFEIELFREYLRIPSVHPHADYKPCIKFLKRQAAALDLAIAVHYPSNAQNPLIVITWPGSEPTLPSILLNSHMDVVPVYPGQWTHPPFGAEMDADGRIFGRGAQDDKPLGTQYLAAIRALKRDGVQRLKRTIHVVYAPDEETGSEHGWSAFVETNEFKAMNAGFLLDEGIGSETAQLDVYYAERKSVKMYVNCTGASGHGLYILPNTAAQKALFMANKLYRLRDSEEQRLRRNASLTIGEVTTINLTVLKGGLLSNVIPGEVMLVFGVRLAIDVPLDYFRAMVDQWATEAGGNVTVTLVAEEGEGEPTAVDATNPFWVALEDAITQSNLTVVPRILGAASDSRFLRRVNIPALGFTPLNGTQTLIHNHDEFITADTYLRGIKVYQRIVSNLGSLE